MKPSPPHVSETLPAKWYHDAAIYQRERKSIFGREWTLLARANQLEQAGDYVSASIADQPVFVIRQRDDTLAGFHNVCRHRASPILNDATGRCSVLRCRYHGWVYDLKGRLISPSGFAESAFNKAEHGLFPLRIATWNGLVFGCLSETTPPLLDRLGDIVPIAKAYPAIENLVFAAEVVRDGRANWKTYGDNSAEGYHLAHVHPQLNQAIGDATVKIRGYENGRFVGFDVRYHGDSEVRSGNGFWIYQFPGLLLHFGQDSINIERVIPVGPGQIRLVRWFWFDADKTPEGQHHAIEDSKRVMNEDITVCEAVQANLEAGVYTKGVLSEQQEPGTIYLQQLVRAALSEPVG